MKAAASMHARVKRASLVLLSVWAGAVLLAPAAEAAKPKLKVAVVNVQEAMRSTPQFKDAEAKLEKERSSRQAALEAKKKALQERKEKLDAQKAVVDVKTLTPQIEELKLEIQKLTQAFMKDQQELTQMEQKLSEQMIARIELVVREVANERDREFVFDTGNDDTPNVLYMEKGIDITPVVVKRYLKRFKDKPLDMN